MSDKGDRAALGGETFERVMGYERPQQEGNPLSEAARDFVFSEVWSRPGLDTRSRYWITLACICAARAPMPIRLYMQATLDSGLITEAELEEFFLQFACYQGFPKAAEAQQILRQVLNERAAASG